MGSRIHLLEYLSAGALKPIRVGLAVWSFPLDPALQASHLQQ